MMRALVYSLTPINGTAQEHVLHCLKALRPHYNRLIVVLNGVLDTASQAALTTCADEVLSAAPESTIENAYRAGLALVGWDRLATFDEVSVMNCDLFGPVFPVDEMFAEMDGRTDLDVWALAEAAPVSSPDAPIFLAQGLVTFRKRLLQSPDFRAYWSNAIRSKRAAFDQQTAIDQARFLQERGYRSTAYLTCADATTPQPLLLEMQEAIRKKRLPFLSFTAFCRSPAYQDERPSNLNQVLPLLGKVSDYPHRLFWQTALKKASLRTLHTNMAYQFTFDSNSYGCEPKWDSKVRIAVCAHVYYPDVLEEILDRARNIPTGFDLFITTASTQNKAVIEERCALAGMPADVRVVGQNRGRDMSSLFIDLKDVVLDGNYDLICRLHSKKSPQVNSSTGVYFKHFIFDSALASREYTSHVLDFFATHPHVGIAVAPMIHTGYGTMGHAWFANRGIFDTIMADLGCKVPPEPYSPLAAYGTVYWFRPDALRPMFEDKYSYEEYNVEPNHVDGGLAHGQERALTYVAQARGYMTATIWPDYVAAQSTTLMEYKMDSLYSYFPAGQTAPHWRLMMLFQNKKLKSALSRKPKIANTPEFLKTLERRYRSKIKQVARKLGIAQSRRLGAEPFR